MPRRISKWIEIEGCIKATTFNPGLADKICRFRINPTLLLHKKSINLLYLSNFFLETFSAIAICPLTMPKSQLEKNFIFSFKR